MVESKQLSRANKQKFRVAKHKSTKVYINKSNNNGYVPNCSKLYRRNIVMQQYKFVKAQF